MKNKKLLILLCIPLIISVMVLPLCSFVTNGTDNSTYTFNSPLWFDLEYQYHRVTATIDKTYTGVIPQFNRILTNSDGAVPTSYASGYVVAGNTSFNYSRISFSFDDPAQERGTGGLLLSSENIDEAYFTGGIRISNTFRVNERADNFASCNLMFPGSSYDILYCTASVIYFGENYEENQIDVSFFGNSEELYGFYTDTIYFTDICSLIYDEVRAVSGRIHEDIFVTNCYLSFSSTDGYPTQYASCEYTGDYISNVQSDVRFDSIYRYYINERIEYLKSLAYNEGFSAGSIAFDSLGEFLTDSVGGFLDFHITPSVTISGILSVILSISLVFLFLRLFAGG